MSQFLDALQAWKGREYVQSHLAQSGFKAFRTYQNAVLAVCAGEGFTTGLLQYWDEKARELILNAGQCEPDRREFTGVVRYRSPYLDSLHEMLTTDERSARRAWPLHPCARRHSLEMVGNDSARRDLLSTIKSEIQYELAEAKRIRRHGQTLVDLVREDLDAFGFRRVDTAVWERRNADATLKFRCTLKTKDAEPDLYFFIVSASDGKARFETGAFGAIVPGAGYYRLDDREASLGWGDRFRIAAFSSLVEAL